MGLDMYLYAKRHISSVFDEDMALAKQLSKTLGYSTERGLGEGISNVIFDIGYWRKANAIHNYFVQEFAEGKDECQQIRVEREDLEKLRDLCKAVLVATNNGKNPEKGADVLPTCGGFFFGSTDYDENYIDDLKNTVAIINKALAEPLFGDWRTEFIYQASW